MDKQKTPHAFALIGDVPEKFRERFAMMKSMVMLSESQLGVVPADSLSHMLALVIGPSVDARTLTTWLPSLRTANPTLCVIGLHNSDGSTDLVRWVDETFSLPDEACAFLEKLIEQNRKPTLARQSIRLGSQLGDQIITFVGLLALWWLLVAIFAPPPFLLPSPVQVAATFFARWERMTMHFLVTAMEAGLGFLVGNSLGIGLAVGLHRFLNLRKMALPVLISFQAIPIVALAPLLGVWLGSGLMAKVAMASIICFFPMVINSLQAFTSVEQEYLELFKLFKAPYLVELRRLLLPASAPGIIAALKISAGLSVVGAIVAEMTGSDRGLGYLILNGAYRLETDIMFVAMLLSALLGVIFFNMPDLIRSFMPKTWSHGLAD